MDFIGSGVVWTCALRRGQADSVVDPAFVSGHDPSGLPFERLEGGFLPFVDPEGDDPDVTLAHSASRLSANLTCHKAKGRRFPGAPSSVLQFSFGSDEDLRHDAG